LYPHSDLAKQIGQANRDKVEQFSMEKMTRDYMNLYEKVLEKSARWPRYE